MSAVVDELARGLQGVRAAGEALVAGLGLVALELPPALGRREGTLRGVPVTLRTRRFGRGAMAALTLSEIAEVEGPLRAVTIIGMPAAGTLAPILGVDLVALGGALSLVAVDLAPVDQAEWAAQAGPLLEQLHLATEERVIPRRWPSFAAEVFSRRALIAGARRGHEAAVLADVAWFVAALIPLYGGRQDAASARAAAADERRRGWCLAERRNRREHDALAQMFGAAWAEGFIDLLFPVGDAVAEGSNEQRGTVGTTGHSEVM